LFKLNKIKILIAIISIIILGFWAIPLPDPLFEDDYSFVVLDENDEILRAFLNKNEQWCFSPDENYKIPDKLETCVLHYEDKYFYYHLGLNPVSLVRASFQNFSSEKIVSGASTITMQLARLIKPKRRTHLNKLLEIFQAVKIEFYYSKINILNTYLHHAPYGGNIVGIKAASLKYFQKYPDQLTWAEAATLAILPNAPGIISPTYNISKLEQKRNNLLKSLHESKIIDKESYILAINEPVPKYSKPFEVNAPHLAQWLRQETNINNVKTTINYNLQENIQDIINRNVNYLKQLGINNGAALVAETKSGKVKAYIGSQEFFDYDYQGQINGVVASRSSGSLLKPFLYALCIDEGIIIPETKIKDIPTYYGTFSPHNASEKFNGLVTAKDALIQSLNVPAVRLLYSYDLYPF